MIDATLMLILAVGGGLAVILLIAGVIVTARSERILVEERIGKYFDEEDLKHVSKHDKKASPIGDWLNRKIEKSSMGGGIARELARADLKMKPGEFVASQVIFGIGSAFVLWYFADRGNSIPVFALLGFVIGWFIPKIYVKQQQGKRLVRFNDQLADMLNLMVNGLRAGYSVMQAMEAVSKEMPAPACDEFRRVVQEMQIGISMGAALDNLLRRIPSEDLDLVITAINVQREVGGNLAEILDTISYTIRERVKVKGEIRVLTTQVKTSGQFLSAMPFFILAALYFFNRSYFMEFINPETRLPGMIALSIGGILIISGYFVMNRIADIEV